jgi:hypothetical protein
MCQRHSTVVTKRGIVKIDKLKIGDELLSGQGLISGTKSYNNILEILPIKTVGAYVLRQTLNDEQFCCNPQLMVAVPIYTPDQTRDDLDWLDHKRLPIFGSITDLSWSQACEIEDDGAICYADKNKVIPVRVSISSRIKSTMDSHSFVLDGDKSFICDRIVVRMN